MTTSKEKIRSEIVKVTRRLVEQSGSNELLNDLRKDVREVLLREGIPYTTTTLNAMVEGVKLAGMQVQEAKGEEAMEKIALASGLLLVLEDDLRQERDKRVPDILK